MESSISSRSLMTGNVSTEESRNEMRKSPGAPSPPAKATTFCFHPLRLDGTRHSSNQRSLLVGAQPAAAGAPFDTTANLSRQLCSVRAACECHLESRRTRGAVRPVKSRMAARRKRHSPAAATELPAPEKTGKASAASRKDILHPRRAARSLRSSPIAASRQPAEVRAKARGAPHESARLWRSGQRPARRQKSVGMHSPPRRQAHYLCKNARGRTCAGGLHCGKRPPPHRCTA